MRQFLRFILPVLVSLFAFSQWAHAAEVKVGIMAPRGALSAMKAWGDLAGYLEAEIGQPVKIVPISPSQAVGAVSNGEVDYALVNPVLTVTLDKKLGAHPLATMKRKTGPQFAGVIIAKKGGSISKGTDLKGKKVMAYKFRRSAAAYVFQVKHLMDQGVDPHKDFAKFVEAKKQDDIVLAVKSGVMDAGFIKTGLLEAMAREGKISMDDFEIVDRRDDGFPHVHSTILYPEWYMTARAGVDGETTAKIKAALLKLGPGDAVSQKAKIEGFVEPLALGDLESTLAALKLPPFEG